MNATFRPHGSFSTRVEGSLIISDITGPWNKELVAAWALQCYPMATALSKSGPYVGIAVISGSMLCPPDAMEALRRAVKYSATSLRCTAHVIVADAGVDGRDFLEPVFARIYEGVVAHRIFYDLDAARAWSLDHLRGHDA